MTPRLAGAFKNAALDEAYGTHSMPETADNVAEDYGITREDQDRFAAESQRRWEMAQKAGRFAEEIVPVIIPQRKGDPLVVDTDEHPRPGTSVETLAKLRGVNGPTLTVTAGNASGVNDGAAGVIVASEAAARTNGLTPKARIVAMAAAGVPPRVMGIGPVPATRRALERAGLTLGQMDVIELNEAFAAQSLAVLRDLGLPRMPHISMPMAVRSPWAIRWGCPGRGSCCTPHTSFNALAGAMRSAPCASGSGRALLSFWNGSEEEVGHVCTDGQVGRYEVTGRNDA